MESPSIRPAGPEDAYALWIWANDGATRSASFGRAPIPWDDHVRWLTGALHDPALEVLVATTAEGQPVGSIRFDTTDGWRTARLSYVVAPESRGQGLSAPIVREGTSWIRTVRAGAAVWAVVMADNLRSLRVFRGLAWREEPGGEGVSRFWAPTEA